jgi:hypothetical protein
MAPALSPIMGPMSGTDPWLVIAVALIAAIAAIIGAVIAAVTAGKRQERELYDAADADVTAIATRSGARIRLFAHI